MVSFINRKHVLIFSTGFALLFALAAILSRHNAVDGKEQIFQPTTKFYVPRPNPDATRQIDQLSAKGDFANAELIKKMLDIPQAMWLTGGTPQKAKQYVENVFVQADKKGSIPILVPYNIPLRDCGQYSAGGTNTPQEYELWINGFASGIGNHKAIIILEPDSLGIIPHYTDIDGNPDWCQPTDVDPITASADRFLMLNYAVNAFKRLPNTKVYLDGTQSHWLSPGDAAYRLVKAGVLHADGFFLNVSNYQYSDQLIKYGIWVSKCIWYATDRHSLGRGKYEDCASQYNPAKENDYSTWSLTDEWYRENVDSQLAYPGESGLIHFVIDTSRNGQGPWIPPSGKYPDAQDWCNAPGRGLGIRPTTTTGQPLLDAYLWIKIPGESDGQCTRGLGPAGTTKDPAWSRIDPVSGNWFPEMALTLAQKAEPPLK